MSFNGKIALWVSDDGPGFAPEDANVSGHFGLSGAPGNGTEAVANNYPI